MKGEANRLEEAWLSRYIRMFSESPGTGFSMTPELSAPTRMLALKETLQTAPVSSSSGALSMVNKAHRAMPVGMRVNIYWAGRWALDLARKFRGGFEWPTNHESYRHKETIDRELKKQGIKLKKSLWKGNVPVCVTHDIDTKYGMERGIFDLLEIEEKHGIKSTIFLVPESHDYNIDERVFSFKNVEFGSHGLEHSGDFSAIGDKERVRRMTESKRLIDSRRKGTVSFRAPWLLRTPDMFPLMEKAGYAIDSSFMDVEAGMKLSGIGLNYPINPLYLSGGSWKESKILELPLAAPMDWDVFVGRRMNSLKTLRMYVNKHETVKRANGIPVFLFHPAKYDTGNPKNLLFYDKFMEHLAADEKTKSSLMKDVPKMMP